MRKMNGNNNLKEAIVFLIAAVMVLSTVAVTANTIEQTQITPTCLNTNTENNKIQTPTANIEQSSPLNSVKESKSTGFGGDRGILWDNGDTDGSNGYSNADSGAFGFRRTLLDDFVIPFGETWIITDFHSLQLWDTMPVGSGTDYLLSFWTDNVGSPDAPFATATTVSYSETATGRQWYGRDEYRTNYTFEPIVLGPGTYWIEGNVIGPENNFWMINLNLTGSQCWVDYEDWGGLMPGFLHFGVFADLAFSLTGEIETDPDVIWNNGMIYQALLAAQWDESSQFDAYPADDFMFDEEMVVDDVHWIGGYWLPDYQTGNFAWAILFYFDRGDGNAPGDVYAGPFIYPQNMCNPVLLEDTGSSIYYGFSVDLDESVLFSGSEKYWISIWGVGAKFPQSGWGYHEVPITLHQAVFKSDYFSFPDWTNAEIVLGYPFDMCFQLTGGIPAIPDLNCLGDLSWTDVEPGAIVTSEFYILNMGDEDSLLDWEITEWPSWGDWTFAPQSGEGLTPADGAITVGVFVEAPDESETEFTGEVKIVNTGDPGDYCIIDVSLATPQSQNQQAINSLFLQFLERYHHAFLILRNILGL